MVCRVISFLQKGQNREAWASLAGPCGHKCLPREDERVRGNGKNTEEQGREAHALHDSLTLLRRSRAVVAMDLPAHRTLCRRQMGRACGDPAEPAENLKYRLTNQGERGLSSSPPPRLLPPFPCWVPLQGPGGKEGKTFWKGKVKDA